MKSLLICLNVPSENSTKRNAYFILLVTIGKCFPLLQTIEDIHFGLVRMCVTPLKSYLLDIYIRFGNKLCRQIVGIPMGTNCAPLVAVFYFVMKENSRLLFLMIIKSISLRHITRLDL